ncbi:hypothetical protein [Actinocorallia aurea]
MIHLHGGGYYHSFRFEALVDAIEAFTAWVRSQERSHRALGRRRP